MTSSNVPVPKSDVMPVFAIKARDHLAMQTIQFYLRLCRSAGLWEQAKQVQRAYAEVSAWRDAHPEECKWPDHEHLPAGEPGSGSEVVASSTNKAGGEG